MCKYRYPRVSIPDSQFHINVRVHERAVYICSSYEIEGFSSLVSEKNKLHGKILFLVCLRHFRAIEKETFSTEIC